MNYTRLINKTEDYIENHLSEKITLFDCANNIGLSAFHFHRIFKANSTETIQQYINRIKLERSAIYLRINKSITITEIAYKYGYGDTSSYIRAFKKHFLTTPKKYRNSKI